MKIKNTAVKIVKRAGRDGSSCSLTRQDNLVYAFSEGIRIMEREFSSNAEAKRFMQNTSAI